MGVTEIQAWVTAAMTDTDVEKALVLAGSLRRVHTAKKLAVLSTPQIADKLRDKLAHVFDIVHLIIPPNTGSLPTPKNDESGKLQAFAKTQAFALRIFQKCVFLAPTTLVVKNCDDIFDKHGDASLALSWQGDAEADSILVDSSVFLFSPSLSASRGLKKIVADKRIPAERGGNDFDLGHYFDLWLLNNGLSPRLEDQYNVRITLEATDFEGSSIQKNLAIVNFTGMHPLDFVKEGTPSFGNRVKNYVVNLCRKIYLEDVENIPESIGELSPNRKYDNEPIAVVGMSFQLPGRCTTPSAFWELLVNGQEAIGPLPPHRWIREHSKYPSISRKVEAGFLTSRIDEFDSKFFGISRKEVGFLDPQQRLLHEVTWEALEDAGIDPSSLRGTRTGMFIGSWNYDYKEMTLEAVDKDFFRSYMGNSVAASAARLSHFFGVVGPSIGTETGCSSAMLAVDLGCKSLRSRETSMALVGGVNLLLHPFNELSLNFVISADGRCKTFDAGADGFGRAEGCAVLVLKRMSDAMRDGDKMWGLIRGSAVTQEGLSRSLGTPTVECESLAMEEALKDAGVEARDVSFVEMHGTGTPVGDPLEVAAVAKAYSKDRSDKLVIGSVKTNVGHTESVSGLTGIIKVLLSMRHQIIPPHLNLTSLNPDINLDSVPAIIPLEPLSWPRTPGKPRLAGVSSFGISGSDAHVILEEPPEDRKSDCAEFSLERPLHLMKVSAKCPESLEELLEKYQEIFEKRSGEPGFEHFAYSANTGRATFSHRATIVAKDFTEAAKVIREKTYRSEEIQGGGTSPICFLFTGQGSQYPGMAFELYSTSPVFQTHFNACASVLQRHAGFDIRHVLWGTELSGEGAKLEELSQTLYSQTAIFCVEYSLLRLWESWGVKPDFVLGHSLGEFAAAVAAGAIGFEDALILVAERSRLIDNLPRGKMLVIKADKRVVEQTITQYKKEDPTFWADYAALNSPDQTVIAGDSAKIEGFAKFCQEIASLKAIILAATHAFHSRHMDPMLDAYRRVAVTAKPFPVGKTSLPKYISGMEGKLIESSSINEDYWVRHTRDKVSFMDACKVVQAQGCSFFIEVGPHPVLSALAMANIDSSITCLPSIRRSEEDWTTLLDSVSRLHVSSKWDRDIDWKGFDAPYQRTKVSLPFYPFNRKSIWIRMKPNHPPIHPLIGAILPTSVGDTIFQNVITLKSVPYLKDHMIGDMVVFPGAGFLEMCLSGCHSAIQGFTSEFTPPRRPVVLKNLRISTPLGIREEEGTLLQTVVTLQDSEEEEIGYSVTIHRQANYGSESPTGGGGHWVSHASAKYLQVASTIPKEATTKLDIDYMRGTWFKSNVSKEFYEKLPTVGLRFGPKFQSLESEWRDNEGKAALVQIKVPEDHRYSTYMVHSVVADAMIQATMIWATKGQLKNRLQVPIAIGEFVWLRAEEKDNDRFVYTSTTSEGTTFALLLDSAGTPLAYMSGVEFMETKIGLIQGMIEGNTLTMPGLWEEIWKEVPGHVENFGCFILPQRFPDETAQTLEGLNKVPEEEQEFLADVGEMACYFVVDALFKLGWKPGINASFKVEGVLRGLSVADKYARYVYFFFRQLAKKFGALQYEREKDSFTFAKIPDVGRILNKLNSCPSLVARVEYKIVAEVGNNLVGIFGGKTDPLQILFPEDPQKVSAGAFYESISNIVLPPVVTANRSLFQRIQVAAENHPDQKPVVRLLEVGAGTGVVSKKVMEFLTEFNLDFEYYYTDVSPAFFTTAEKKLEQFSKKIVFKKYDIEKDPFEQGLCPHYFDIIAAIEVLHVAKDLRKLLRCLRTLLRPNGVLEFFETVKKEPRITFIFGLLDGYWGFEDFDIRPYHVTLPLTKWTDILKKNGFPIVEAALCHNSAHGFIYATASDDRQVDVLTQTGSPKHAWLIFQEEGCRFAEELAKRLETLNRRVIRITKPKTKLFTEENMIRLIQTSLQAVGQNETLEGVLYLWGLESLDRSQETLLRDQRQLALPFVSLCQALVELPVIPRTFAVTRGATCIPDGGLPNPAPSTIGGIVRTVNNEFHLAGMCHLDLSPEEFVIDQVDPVFYNLWATQNHDTIAFRQRKRLQPKLTAFKPRNEYLSLPNGSDRFQLALPSTHMISDLEYTTLDSFTLAEDEIEVQTKAIALNFRDILTVLKPIAMFESLNTVGLDISGEVVRIGSNVKSWKIGDRVIGLNTDRDLAMPSHIKLKEASVMRLPHSMTYAEGCTLPAVYMTSFYCLLTLTTMKRGETVLIHTATGGVGLSAIQVANHTGVNIIATAGSPRKRNYLRKLGIQHVFNSRSTEFGAKVLEVTNGRGVDIVLNSLTGPGFKEASLGALAKNGRFIEMSKLNIWSVEEVSKLRPDVFYAVSYLPDLPDEVLSKLQETLQKHLKEGKMTPISYERFDALNIRGALNYLQKAKHIGKIVCIMPELRVERSKLIAETPTFNPESTYLVTGGLGGIGFEVVKWMVKNGAKTVVTANRSEARPEIRRELEDLNKCFGSRVEAFPLDIGYYEDCQKLFEHLKNPKNNFPVLRGVMHCAGVLRDALITNQSWASFEETFNPKVSGSWNLHDLTKDLPLEFFVMFSSVTAPFGTPGQANHCAANSFEDALAFHRKSLGLPATTINWGNWGEVGVATELDFSGGRPIATAQGLKVVESFLKTGRLSGIVLNVDSFGLLSKVFPRLKTYLDDKRLLGETKSGGGVYISSEEFWKRMDAAEEDSEKMEVLQQLIKTTVRSVLKMDADEEIGDAVEFQVLGIDSLMMLEMKNGLQNVLGNRVVITASQMKDCTTPVALAKKVVEILGGQEDASGVAPTGEELGILVREDAKLLSEIFVDNISRAKDISELEVILLTGVTGTLGPYMLKELSHRRGIKKVICLIRKSGKLSPKDRLEKKLTHLQLLNQVDLEKVECLAGDITVDRIELNEVDYTRLVSEVDAVVHCAILADHTAKYYKSPSSRRKTLRSVNVLGTQRIIQLCAEGRLKHLFYASSLLPLTTCEEDGRLNENWQDIGAFDEFTYNSGYMLTKHVAELLVQDAIERLHIPAKAVRLPLIGGDSQTGQCDYSSNHLLLRCLTFMKLGVMPDTPTPIPLMPVDTCARVSVALFFHPEAPSDVYNLAPRTPPIEQVVVSILSDPEFGFNIQLVTWHEFLERLQTDNYDNSLLAPFRDLYEDSSVVDVVSSAASVWLHKFAENPDSFFNFEKILRHLPHLTKEIEPPDQVLRRDLLHLKTTGVFQRLGIRL